MNESRFALHSMATKNIFSPSQPFIRETNITDLEIERDLILLQIGFETLAVEKIKEYPTYEGVSPMK